VDKVPPPRRRRRNGGARDPRSARPRKLDRVVAPIAALHESLRRRHLVCNLAGLGARLEAWQCGRSRGPRQPSGRRPRLPRGARRRHDASVVATTAGASRGRRSAATTTICSRLTASGSPRRHAPNPRGLPPDQSALAAGLDLGSRRPECGAPALRAPPGLPLLPFVAVVVEQALPPDLLELESIPACGIAASVAYGVAQAAASCAATTWRIVGGGVGTVGECSARDPTYRVNGLRPPLPPVSSDDLVTEILGADDRRLRSRNHDSRSRRRRRQRRSCGAEGRDLAVARGCSTRREAAFMTEHGCRGADAGALTAGDVDGIVREPDYLATTTTIPGVRRPGATMPPAAHQELRRSRPDVPGDEQTDSSSSRRRTGRWCCYRRRRAKLHLVAPCHDAPVAEWSTSSPRGAPAPRSGRRRPPYLCESGRGAVRRLTHPRDQAGDPAPPRAAAPSLTTRARRTRSHAPLQ